MAELVMPSSTWPLFDLTIETPHLVLRYPTDDDLMQLASCASAGVHDRDYMPFTIPWTDAESDQELQQSVLQYHWRCRGEWKPEKWNLPFVVLFKDQVIGTQEIESHDFATLKTIGTGSWLGLSWQGQGIGKEMRAAVLSFSFYYLNAERAETGALAGNESSLGVTRSLGYEPNGSTMHSVRGKSIEQFRFVMDRKTWQDRVSKYAEIKVQGFDACTSMFGLGDA